MQKIGLKLFPNRELFFRMIKNYPHIDFIEIMGIVGEEYNWLKSWKKEIVIHLEHEEFGINFANKKKKNINLCAAHWSQKLADKFNSKKIIVHPGYIEDAECSLQETIQQLKALKEDKKNRFILENLIYICEKRYMFAYDREQLAYLCKKLNTGICLDLSHAIISAKELKINPAIYLKKLKNLPIKHIHLSDGRMEFPDDLHLHLGDGNFPLKKYMQFIPKNVDITLETGKDVRKTKRDVLFVKQTI